MNIWIDIDGTIAGGNKDALMAACAKFLHLPEGDWLTWSDWLKLPEVVAYREDAGEEKWGYQLKVLGLSSTVQSSLPALDGALVGVQMLATCGHVRYLTCRKTNFSTGLNKMMAETTTGWLIAQGFPNPEEAVFCEELGDKLAHIAHAISESGEPAMLIDDLAAKIATSVNALDEADQGTLKQAFTLCEYGGKQAPSAPFQTACLPSWGQEHVKRLLVDISLVERVLR